VQKLAKLSITQLGIVRFHSNFVQTLSTWHLMYYKCLNGSKVKVTVWN